MKSEISSSPLSGQPNIYSDIIPLTNITEEKPLGGRSPVPEGLSLTRHDRNHPNYFFKFSSFDS